jgi:hypothetical protein
MRPFFVLFSSGRLGFSLSEFQISRRFPDFPRPPLSRSSGRRGYPLYLALPVFGSWFDPRCCSLPPLRRVSAFTDLGCSGLASFPRSITKIANLGLLDPGEQCVPRSARVRSPIRSSLSRRNLCLLLHFQSFSHAAKLKSLCAYALLFKWLL